MKFAIYAKEGVSQRSRSALADALAEVDRCFREWDKLIKMALRHDKLSRRSKRFIRDQWFGDPRGGPLSLGTRAVHRAATIASIITLLVHAQNEPQARKGRLRLRMLTVSADMGITDFDAPELDLAAVVRHFDVAARRASLTALSFIDFAMVHDHSGLSSTKIAMHVHAAVRATYPWFRVKNAERAGSPRHTPNNQLGLKVVKISSKRRDWGSALKRRHVALLGYYISKRSCGRKIIFDQNGERKTKTSLDRWGVVEVLRQLECYSHCDALQTTRGIGSGKALRKAWKHTLLRLLKYRTPLRGLKINHVQLTAEWERIWLELGAVDMRALVVAASN